jgi:hypothetical protein
MSGRLHWSSQLPVRRHAALPGSSRPKNGSDNKDLAQNNKSGIGPQAD